MNFKFLNDKVDEDSFWRFVELVNWDSRCVSYYKVKAALIHSCSEETLDALEKLFSQQIRRVSKAISSLNGTKHEVDLWNDSRDDLIAHIVGLGKELCEQHINTPILIYERARRGDYLESFSYCFAGKIDRKLSNKYPYTQLADRLTEELNEQISRRKKALTSENFEADADIRLYKRGLEVIRSLDVKAAEEIHPSVVKAADRLRARGFSIQWGLENGLHDLFTYMGND